MTKLTDSEISHLFWNTGSLNDFARAIEAEAHHNGELAMRERAAKHIYQLLDDADTSRAIRSLPIKGVE